MTIRKCSSVVLLFFHYLLVSVLLSEGGVRLAHVAPPAQPPDFFWHSPHPITGWSLQPGAGGRWYNPMYEYDTQVQINSRGLRTPEEIGYARPDGVYRVLVLGDSFVEAAQVALAENFPQQLGRLMREAGMQVEVLNAGVSGWGTDQELLWLREEGARYRPDLVLLAVYPRNDFMNNHRPLEVANFGSIQKPFFHLEQGRLALDYFPFDPAQVPRVETADTPVDTPTETPGPLSGVGKWLHRYSALYRYLDPRIRIVAPRLAACLARTGLLEPGQESKIVAQGDDYIPLAYQVYRQPTPPEWEASFALTGVLFAAVKEAGESMGAEVAAVLVTVPELVYPREWGTILSRYPAMQGQRWSLELPGQKAASLLAQAGIPILDLLPLFQDNAGRAQLHLTNDGHWTPAGHALAAVGVFNFLSQSGLVPQLGGATVPATVPRPARTAWGWTALAVLLVLVVSLLWDLHRTGPLRWLRRLGAGLSTAGELVVFLARRRQYTLLPLVTVLLLFGGLLIIAQASVVGPFIYTLF